MQLVDALPRTSTLRAIANQLVRGGTSVTAHYRAARRGRPTAEFIAKLGTVEEEADESALWMELIIEGHLLDALRVRPLHDESRQLVAIMAASRITASKNRRTNSIANRKSAIHEDP